MKKHNLFYFVHAHGNGHKATFSLLYLELSLVFNVIGVSTNKGVSQYLNQFENLEILELPPKYPDNYAIPEHTFSKAFEVTPYATEPASRAEALAKAIQSYHPKAFYCDGVPELAIMVRGMGVPVVLVRLPGNVMIDPTQNFAYELADQIIAHFPAVLEQKDYKYSAKTYYSGYLSKYASQLNTEKRLDCKTITVLLGFDNYSEAVLKNITANKQWKYTIIGNKYNYNLGEHCTQLGKVKNISEHILGNIVISAAGQNTVAELLSLGKCLILLPEQRPYDEQSVHASSLADNHLALLAQNDFTAKHWLEIIHIAQNKLPIYDHLVNANAAKEIAQKLKNWYV